MLASPIEIINELLERGGPVFAIILSLSILMWFLIFERYWYLYLIHPLRLRQCVIAWQCQKDRSSWRARQLRAGIIADLTISLRTHLRLIRTLTVLLPLLGLLGTVIGLISSFEVMSVFGMANSRGLARGVSQALLSTAAGLVTSISGLYFSAHLQQQIKIEKEMAANLLAQQ